MPGICTSDRFSSASGCRFESGPTLLPVFLQQALGFTSIPTTMSGSENIEAALKANLLAAQHGIDLSKLPKIVDMSASSITSNVHAINSNCNYSSMVLYEFSSASSTQAPTRE